MTELKKDKTLDARGLSCPMPSVRTALALEDMQSGEVLEILTDDPVSKRDLPAWAESTGNEILSVVEEDGMVRIFLRKG